MKELSYHPCEPIFIINVENVLITGTTGCVKSSLACALGRMACMNGYKALLYRTAINCTRC
ncbi:MAG TPA: ATP-binding protein [Niastella sp.]